MIELRWHKNSKERLKVYPKSVVPHLVKYKKGHGGLYDVVYPLYLTRSDIDIIDYWAELPDIPVVEKKGKK